MALDIIPRIKNYAVPLLIITASLISGFLTIFELIFYDLRPLLIFQPSKLRDRWFANAWKKWGPLSAKSDASGIEEICKLAYGVVVDVGPGTGLTLKYLDKSKITRAFGIEPNLLLHDELRKEIKNLGLEDVYTIVGLGLEALPIPSIELGTVDTILSIKVLCSIPDPEKVLPTGYELLKPGGQFLVYEHVKSKDPITSQVQRVYQFFWPTLLGGCNINRDTETLLGNAGKWDKVEVEKKKGEARWDVLPHSMGRFVKAG